MANQQPNQPRLTPQQEQRQAEAKRQAEATKAAQDALRAQQLKSPALPPDPPPPALPPGTGGSWQDRAAAYLESRGWEPCGTNYRGQTLWEDPLNGSKVPERVVHVKDLPSYDPTVPPMQVKQLVVPPVRWDTPTEEAYAIQRARDKAAGAAGAGQASSAAGATPPLTAATA